MFSLIVFLEELQVIFQLLEVFSKFFQTPDFFFSKSAFSQTGSKSLNDLIQSAVKGPLVYFDAMVVEDNERQGVYCLNSKVFLLVCSNEMRLEDSKTIQLFAFRLGVLAIDPKGQSSTF